MDHVSIARRHATGVQHAQELLCHQRHPARSTGSIGRRVVALLGGVPQTCSMRKNTSTLRNTLQVA